MSEAQMLHSPGCSAILTRSWVAEPASDELELVVLASGRTATWSNRSFSDCCPILVDRSSGFSDRVARRARPQSVGDDFFWFDSLECDNERSLEKMERSSSTVFVVADDFFCNCPLRFIHCDLAP
jgi:hypothetical protein